MVKYISFLDWAQYCRYTNKTHCLSLSKGSVVIAVHVKTSKRTHVKRIHFQVVNNIEKQDSTMSSIDDTGLGAYKKCLIQVRCDVVIFVYGCQNEHPVSFRYAHKDDVWYDGCLKIFFDYEVRLKCHFGKCKWSFLIIPSLSMDLKGQNEIHIEFLNTSSVLLIHNY